jgi:biopolymer transport protein ExbB/TolQ
MMRDLEDKVAATKSKTEASVPSTNRPLRIVGRLLKTINSIPNQGDEFTNRERVWLLSMVNSLSHTVGRCERLVQTPVPLSYARHTSRFVSVWTLTLPLALVPHFRWLTAPVIFFITWAMFGILEIGHMIEDPFRASLELTPICQAIYHDAERSLPNPVNGDSNRQSKETKLKEAKSKKEAKLKEKELREKEARAAEAEHKQAEAKEGKNIKREARATASDVTNASGQKAPGSANRTQKTLKVEMLPVGNQAPREKNGRRAHEQQSLQELLISNKEGRQQPN